MILVCSECSANYLVSASVFASGPRMVKCARCGHVWKADLPPKIMAMPQDEAAVSSSERQSEEPRKKATKEKYHANLPAVFKKKIFNFAKIRNALLAIVVIAALSYATYEYRQALVDMYHSVGEWTQKVIGLVSRYKGVGLEIKNVRSERRFEDGGMKLFVEGEILNNGNKLLEIPDIKVTAKGPDGKITQSWKIMAPRSSVNAMETVPFSSLLGTTQDAVVEVELSFVGKDSEFKE